MTKIVCRFVCLASLAVGLAACDDDYENCNTEWGCINGACTCEIDDIPCTDPDLTTSDDDDNCNNRCIFCYG